MVHLACSVSALLINEYLKKIDFISHAHDLTCQQTVCWVQAEYWQVTIQ